MYQYTILRYFIFLQFNPHFAGDLISIQEIDSNENLIMVAYLTGPNLGPKYEWSISNWNKKTISSSTNRMHIEFKSDDIMEYKGFSANIIFKPFPNKECESWLNMNTKTFKSPNYPQTYHNFKKCNWLITIDHDYHVTLDVTEYYVRY